MTVLIGGVGQLYQGDLDLGRRAASILAQQDLGPGVVVEELHYGAIAVAQRLEELKPAGLILIGAEARGRPPGSVHRRLVRSVQLNAADFQAAVHDAGTGYVTIDLLLSVGAALGALPLRTVTIEVEPARTNPAEKLSSPAACALEEAVELVRAEARRTPLLELAEELRELVRQPRLQPAPALRAMTDLLGELRLLEEEGRWGAAFSLRDEVRLQISAGHTGEGMSHLDWGLWWTLLEELDRLQPLEAKSQTS